MMLPPTRFPRLLRLLRRSRGWAMAPPAGNTALTSALVCLLLLGCGSDEPSVNRPPVTVTPDADILYEGYRSGYPEVLILSLSGGEPVRVLPAETSAFDPVATADGSRMLYVVADYVARTGDIFVVNRDGSGARQLTRDEALDDQPSFSPDGRRIAFRSYRTQALGDIWVMDAHGASLINLTPDPLPTVTDEARPAWSPAGDRIAYASNYAGTMDIWTMRPDGSQPRQITFTSDEDTEPTFSPDGKRIAFRRSSPLGGDDILVVDVEGGEPLRLAHEGEDRCPAWSPDGTLIAFVRHSGTAAPQIYTMRPDGSDRVLRSADGSWGGGLNPAWIKR